MKLTKKILTASAACFALATPAAVQADTTVTTQTYVKAQELEDVNKINFSEFDLNEDGL